MAATLSIVKLTGAGPTENTITELVLGTADIADPLQAGTANFYPIARPTAGFSYSYWASVALKATGTFTDIRNIRWYISTDPAWNLGTAGAKWIANRDTGDIGCPSGSYDQATGTQNESGDNLDDATNGHAYYKSQTTPFVVWGTWTTGSPATVDSNFYTTAFTSQHVVIQLKVDTDSDFASLTGGQMTFRAQVVN